MSKIETNWRRVWRKWKEAERLRGCEDGKAGREEDEKLRGWEERRMGR